ncbi:fatty-acid--CoA ligase [Mycobacterium sp.]|uniref:fatty-acid--CoA ligase n=1 Tax=Mycobacterium sp. TaxID=1785 RepID=UPI002CA5D40B|nr:fatty-acid--CoA ligase [Mycobacterium sp.]HME50056.1 fatty-acid--CoA ligase [Mycobacterium sp.]
MSDTRTPTLILASDYRVPDPGRVWPLLQRRKAELAGLGAHHVLVYASTTDEGRVLVTMGIRNPEPVVDLLRSRVWFDWFDAVGVTDIPGVFAGEMVEKLELTTSSEPAPPGIVMAAMTSVRDVSTLIGRVRLAADRLRAAGIRKIWFYRAFDDEHEVLILQEIDSEEDARRWIQHPDGVAEWMVGAGVGPYPPLFVGEFVNMMRIEENA